MIWFIVCHDCPATCNCQGGSLTGCPYNECTFDSDNFEDFRKSHEGHRLEDVQY